jgi:hypothetical protein
MDNPIALPLPEQQAQQETKNTTTTTTVVPSPSSAPPFQFNYLATHPTSWDPTSLEIPLNIRLDGCIVPSSSASEGARISFSHLIVLDGLVDDVVRNQLQKILISSDSGDNDTKDGVRHLPPEKWERKTADMAGAAPTWGLQHHVLQTLLGAGGGGGESSSSLKVPDAVLEVQSRLVKLYPEYRIAYLPSQTIQTHQQQQDDLDLEFKNLKKSKRVRVNSEEPTSSGAVDCSAILANAAAEGDTFRYHVDADPTSFPPSSWTERFGEYFNGEPGKPLLVTLLVYLDDRWRRDFGGETLFLDGATDTGVFVRPRPGRAILMEQDVVHKVNPPSSLAEGRLRLSLVWKLAFIPRHSGEAVKLSRREWGPPTSFGSAARVEAVKRQLLASEKKQTC